MRPKRGEIWLADLDPTIGHEQAGRRPALVVSVDAFNQSGADLAIVVPMTSRARAVRAHVAVPAGESGLPLPSYAKCENVRSVSIQRLGKRLGAASPATLATVEDVLRLLLGL